MLIYRANGCGCGMQNDTLVLDQLRGTYKAAVEEWIAAIRQEEALASVDHSVAEVVNECCAQHSSIYGERSDMWS
jgi:hypothetical protein